MVGVMARVDGVAQGGPEAPDFVAGQGNEVLDAACGVPLWPWMRSVWAVTARNAAASMDRVMCRYQASWRRTW